MKRKFKNYQIQKNAGIKPAEKPLTDGEILYSLKRLWNLAEGKEKEKTEYYQKHRKALGEEQELRRQINELLKKNAE